MPLTLLLSLACLLCLALALLGLARWRWWGFTRLLRLAHTQAQQPLCLDTPTAAPALAPQTTLHLTLRPPRVSIVLVSDNDAPALEAQLPLLLTQDFTPYEVIVADRCTDEGATAQLVKRLQATHLHLRYIAVSHPLEAYHAQRLLLTLGIRSARAPWVLLTQPATQPASPHWLAGMLAAAEGNQPTETKEQEQQETPETAVRAVLGYANFIPEAEESLSRRIVHLRLLRFARQAEGALRGCILGADAANLLLHREWCLGQGALSTALSLPFGEVSLFLAHQLPAAQVRLQLHPDCFVRQVLPSHRYLRRWLKEARAVVKASPARHSWLYLRERCCHALLGLSCCATLLLLLLRGLRLALCLGGDSDMLHTLLLPHLGQLLPLPSLEPLSAPYGLIDGAMDSAFIALIGLGLILPIVQGNRLRRCFGEKPHYAYHHLYALLQVWRRAL